MENKINIKINYPDNKLKFCQWLLKDRQGDLSLSGYLKNNLGKLVFKKSYFSVQ